MNLKFRKMDGVGPDFIKPGDRLIVPTQSSNISVRKVVGVNNESYKTISVGGNSPSEISYSQMSDYFVLKKSKSKSDLDFFVNEALFNTLENRDKIYTLNRITKDNVDGLDRGVIGIHNDNEARFRTGRLEIKGGDNFSVVYHVTMKTQWGNKRVRRERKLTYRDSKIILFDDFNLKVKVGSKIYHGIRDILS